MALHCVFDFRDTTFLRVPLVSREVHQCNRLLGSHVQGMRTRRVLVTININIAPKTAVGERVLDPTQQYHFFYSFSESH